MFSHDTLIALCTAFVITALFLVRYLRTLKKKELRARQAAEKGKLYSDGPRGQHPHIDTAQCIGCGGCTSVCPEGDVLAMLGAKAAIVHPHKCVGHSLCAEACPVGAISMVRASPSMGADLPCLTPEYETSIANMFIVGELGGLALIKNAVNEGRECIDTIANRLPDNHCPRDPSVHDVLIVGAGPAGITASLRCIEKKLTYITLEQDEVGGTVAKFPRQKLVMTSPVEFPVYGKLPKNELSKEHLLGFWDMVLNRVDFNVRTGERVQEVKKDVEGIFTVVTTNNQYRSRNVVLALGRSGTPRKLGVYGEDLPKVMYRLIEADHYTNKAILVVGGGDSAVEAALGLAFQVGNKVTISYRGDSFHRIKERNSKRLEEAKQKNKITVLLNSNVVEFKEKTVVLKLEAEVREIDNDFAWIFAGGQPPTELLKKFGIQTGMSDLTGKASEEAAQAQLYKAQPA